MISENDDGTDIIPKLKESNACIGNEDEKNEDSAGQLNTKEKEEDVEVAAAASAEDVQVELPENEVDDHDDNTTNQKENFEQNIIIKDFSTSNDDDLQYEAATSNEIDSSSVDAIVLEEDDDENNNNEDSEESGSTHDEADLDESKYNNVEDVEGGDDNNDDREGATATIIDHAIEIPDMPLLKYGRLVGSLPRREIEESSPHQSRSIGEGKTRGQDDNGERTAKSERSAPSNTFLKQCTACTMGRIKKKGNGVSAVSLDDAGANAAGNVEDDQSSSNWCVLVFGFVDGEIHMVDARTGLHICLPQDLCVDPRHQHTRTQQSQTAVQQSSSSLYSITALSMDATGRTLVACQSHGAVAVWDLKWATSDSDIAASYTRRMYTAGINRNDGLTRTTAAAVHCLLSSGPLLLSSPSAASSTPPFRFSYPLDSRVSCMTIDPAYSRRSPRSNEGKQILTGFKDGRLVLTKRNYGMVDSSSLASGPSATGMAGGGGTLADDGGASSSSFLGGLWSNLGTMMKKAPTTEKVLYQSPNTSSGEGGGIETISWRGNLVAWVDTSSGIKLMDTSTWVRLAHIDRPVGARASLYRPHIVGPIRCSLSWETSKSLLVAWGDCLMSLQVVEQIETVSTQTSSGQQSNPMLTKEEGAIAGSTSSQVGTTTTSDSSYASSGNTNNASSTASTASVQQKRRTLVKCSMAWELDCVACGVAPVDDTHVAVLGIVLPSDTSNNESDETKEQVSEEDSTEQPQSRPRVELQFISKDEGSMKFSNTIPLMLSNPTFKANTTTTAAPKESTPVVMLPGEISFLSSYSTSRDEDFVEFNRFSIPSPTGLLERGVASSTGTLSASVTPSPSATSTKQGAGTEDGTKETPAIPTDAMPIHQNNWNMDYVLCTSDAYMHPYLKRKLNFVQAQGSATSTNEQLNHVFPSPPVPPMMVMCSSLDAILASTRDVDDAISHARSYGDSALALLRGWFNAPLSRKVSLDLLVNEYLASLLRKRTPQSMAHASMCMDTLLRGNADLLEKWVCVFSKLPGGLFALREYIPVRDPMLLPEYYELALETMLTEIENDESASFEKSSVFVWAKKQLFHAMLAWGPISALVERIQLLQHARRKYYRITHGEEDGASTLTIANHNEDNMNEITKKHVRRMALDLYRRRHQKAMEHAEALLSLDNPHHFVNLINGKEKELIDRELEERQNMINMAMEYVSQYSAPSHSRFSTDSLFDMVKLASHLVPRMTMMYASQYSSGDPGLIKRASTNKTLTIMNAVTEALAELSFLRGEYVDAMRLFLILAANRPGPRLDEAAVKQVQHGGRRGQEGGRAKDATIVRERQNQHQQQHDHLYYQYEFVLIMIERHNLFPYLLDQTFLPVVNVNSRNPIRGTPSAKGPAGGSTATSTKDFPTVRSLSPIVALIHLVGLQSASIFLLDHCVSNSDHISDGLHSSVHSGSHAMVTKEGSTTVQRAITPRHHHDGADGGADSKLPLSAVVQQLSGRPKLLHWYLHRIFLCRPEVYVDLSHMAVAPREVLDLHRKHFELHVKYHDSGIVDDIDDNKNNENATSKSNDLSSKSATLASSAVLDNNKVIDESPLMAFLKVTMPYGGVDAPYARKLIEQHRKEAFAEAIETNSPKPHGLLARELAYVVEQSNKHLSFQDAKFVLQLYLEEVQSLPLAVTFAENNAEHSAKLWELLVSYCLDSSRTTSGDKDNNDEARDDSTSANLFGALLEAAAQSGADLAHLISEIPEGMHIQRLKPMLVAAVSHYKFSVKVHEMALDSVYMDKIARLAELRYRSNRAPHVVGARSRADLVHAIALSQGQEPTLEEASPITKQATTPRRRLCNKPRSLSARLERLQRLKQKTWVRDDL